ncbi:rRNA maturation RNase YbeY [Jannaschia sp. W003]|uniref:rRNA maturation RNase YbeY n=1 Tax=Jannaschia sp. W003 TaxID=2867012 RepID=UPI0021A26564|nr:rRNA maturation RNase YbeY [Jannaschia sp. W003]UWQ22935.1 rRNA maturation RNase YbeY [Jannaschia sp. W003]
MTDAHDIDVIHEGGAWDAEAVAPLARRAVAAALARCAPGLGGAEVAVLLCDDARIAALNGDFRGKPRPTNVLSWPSAERGAASDGGAPAPPEDPELGDVAIAFETCAREAAEQGKPFADYVAHLLVHATLHLLGFDHERDGDAARMEAEEVRILADLGLPDPYVLEASREMPQGAPST